MSFSLTGQLLVSRPILKDPNFDGTITLLLEHSADGAIGVILNRPSELTIAETFAPWSSHVSEPSVVFAGGPVERSALVALGATPDADGDLVFGLHSVDFAEQAPEEALGNIDRLRVFGGYAGWSGGQLEGEIANDAWWVVDGFVGDLFTDRPDRLWADVLRRNGGEMAWFAHFPEDASLN